MDHPDQGQQGEGGQRIDQGPLRQVVGAHPEQLEADAQHQNASERTELLNQCRGHALPHEPKRQRQPSLEHEDAHGRPQHATPEGGREEGAGDEVHGAFDEQKVGLVEKAVFHAAHEGHRAQTKQDHGFHKAATRRGAVLRLGESRKTRLKFQAVPNEGSEDQREKEVDGVGRLEGHHASDRQGEQAQHHEHLVLQFRRPSGTQCEAGRSANRHGEGVEECADHVVKLPLGFHGPNSCRVRS